MLWEVLVLLDSHRRSCDALGAPACRLSDCGNIVEEVIDEVGHRYVFRVQCCDSISGREMTLFANEYCLNIWRLPDFHNDTSGEQFTNVGQRAKHHVRGR